MRTVTVGGKTFALPPTVPDDARRFVAVLRERWGEDAPDRMRTADLPVLDVIREFMLCRLRAVDPTVTPEWVSEQTANVYALGDAVAEFLAFDADWLTA